MDIIYIVSSLFQNNRIKGIEEQLKLLFTSGIAAALSTSQNSSSVSLAFNNSLTAATSQPAIIQSSPTPAITPTIMPAATPAVIPAVTPAATSAVTPAVIPAVTPAATPAVIPAVTPAATPVVTPAVTTNQTPVLPSPAVVNASTSGNVVSKSANNPITSMSEILGFKLNALYLQNCNFIVKWLFTYHAY